MQSRKMTIFICVYQTVTDNVVEIRYLDFEIMAITKNYRFQISSDFSFKN